MYSYKLFGIYSSTQKHAKNLKRTCFFVLYLKRFTHMYPDYQSELYYLDLILDEQKLVLSICPLSLNKLFINCFLTDYVRSVSCDLGLCIFQYEFVSP